MFREQKIERRLELDETAAIVKTTAKPIQLQPNDAERNEAEKKHTKMRERKTDEIDQQRPATERQEVDDMDDVPLSRQENRENERVAERERIPSTRSDEGENGHTRNDAQSIDEMRW